MTRDEFIDNIEDFGDLKEFCYENECDYLDNIYHSDDLDQMVCEDIRDATRGLYWYQIRDELSVIPELDDDQYFRADGSFDYVALDDSDFDGYKRRVLNWADNNDVWEDDDDWLLQSSEEPFDRHEPEEESWEPVSEEDMKNLIGGDLCG